MKLHNEYGSDKTFIITDWPETGTVGVRLPDQEWIDASHLINRDSPRKMVPLRVDS